MTESSTLVFDLDGTLTDPKLGITRCIVHALEEMGFSSPNSDDLVWCIGPPLHGSFKKLLETEDDTLASHALSLYRERFSEVGLYENTLYEGIPEALENLSQEGCRLFVATSKPHIYATRILEHFDLENRFERIYGSELDGRNSEKGDLLSHLVNTERIDPNSAAMIGDREHDILGAAKAGMKGIGVLYGYGTHQELSNAGAAALCSNPFELSQTVSELLSRRKS